MSADIDIDFADRTAALALVKHISAARHPPKADKSDHLVAHNTGVYFQPIPYNPITNLASIDYKEADARGYFKVDFLNVGLYQGVKDEDHLVRLMTREPLWELLEQDDFSNLLFHVNGHGSILREMKPTSVEQLAAVLSMIRPAKRYLVGKDWQTVMNEAWTRPAEEDGYHFKKSHSIAYAVAIVVQMNLICEQLD